MSKPSTYLGSVSDLMAGLMIVFMFIAISYMVDIKSKEGEAQIKAEQLEKALSESELAVQQAEDAKAKVLALNSKLEEQKGELLLKTDQLEDQKKNLEAQKEAIERQREHLATTNATIKEITATYSELQVALYNSLREEFKDDLPKWKATLEKDNTIRFNEPEILFNTGDSVIRDRFKEILNDFYPRYLRVVYQERFRKEIDELRIEGHTSSIWKNTSNVAERYLKNSELSQQRAQSVLEYCFNLSQYTQYQEWMIRDIRSNGVSFAKPILDLQGNEDQQRSQRVEFRVITKSQEKILKIIEANKEEIDG